MKRFKFRLQKVLQHRQNIKEEKRRLLAQANLKLMEASEHLEALERSQVNNRVDAKDAPISFGAFQLAGMYAYRLKEEIRKQKEVIVEAEKDVALAMTEYLQANREMEALEKLKSKRFTEYQDLAAKEDTKFLDEIAVLRGNRLNQGEVK